MSPLRGPPFIALGVVGVLVIGACADGPTSPALPGDEASALAAPPTMSSDLAPIRIAIEDATVRLLPALGDASPTGALHAALARLQAGLGADGARASARLLDDAAAALAAIEAAAAADGAISAELAAIRLALATAETFLITSPGLVRAAAQERGGASSRSKDGGGSDA